MGTITRKAVEKSMACLNGNFLVYASVRSTIKIAIAVTQPFSLLAIPSKVNRVISKKVPIICF